MRAPGSRPQRPTRNTLPYPGQIDSDPMVKDIVKILSGDLRGDLGIVERYVSGAVKPYAVKVGREEHYYSANQILPVH